MNKKVVAIVGGVLLLLLVLFATAGVYGYNKFLRPAAAFAESTEAMNNFKSGEFSFQQDTTMEMEFLGELEGLIPAQTLESSLEGSGKVDITNKKLYMKTRGDVDGEEIPEFEYYLIGEDLYLVQDGETTKMSLEDAMAQLGDSIEDIDSFKSNQLWTNVNTEAEYELVGETTVDGKKVYEYKVKMTEEDIKTFKDALVQGLEASLATEDVEVKTTVGEIEYRIYVSKEDNSPVKEDIKIDQLVIEFVDLMKLTMSDYSMNIVYKSVNESIEINAPAVD